MSHLLEGLLGLSPVWVYLAVAALVFAEDALFFGFVIPGETAAILGGVDASRGHVHLTVMILVVVLCAIVGDSVGYEVGRKLGPRLLNLGPLRKHRDRVSGAQDLLARRGGAAVFLGRFIAFFRAVMPALAGLSRMPYPRFLTFNAAGGVVWGAGAVVLGYVAGSSYETVARTVGRGSAIAIVAVIVLGVIAWRVREHRGKRAHGEGTPQGEGKHSPQ
jgi:membrane-associated protein